MTQLPVAQEHSAKQNSCDDLALAAEYLQLRSGLQALRKGCEGAARRLEQVALASGNATFESQAGSSQHKELTVAGKRVVQELAASQARAAAETSIASELLSLRTELVQERAESSAVVEAVALARMRELACREEMQAERLLLRTELEEASCVTFFLRDALEAEASQREELLVASHENQAAALAEHKAVVECLHRDLSEEAARAEDARQQKMIEETMTAHVQTVEAALAQRGSLAGRAWRQRRQERGQRVPAEEHGVMTLSVGCCSEHDLELQLLPPLPPPLSPPSSSMQQTCGSIACGPLHEELFTLQAAASAAESEVATLRAEFDAVSKAEARALFAALDEAEVAAGLCMDLERERARHEYTIGAAESTEARYRAELAAATADAPSPHWQPSEELWWAGVAPQVGSHHSIGDRSNAALRSRPHCAWWPWRWT